MERCDVLVVGGGPAGSSCAWRLRGSGLDVLVWDARRFPRDKVCAGWITPQVLDELDIDAGEYARGRVLQPITGFRIGRMGDREASIDYGRPVSYGIRRCEFDHYLLERSEARLRLGAPVRDLRREGGEWLVNGEVRARMLVGAGGHFCPVARALGGGAGAGERVIVAREAEFRLPAAKSDAWPVDGARPELCFTADLKGYGWVFRKGDFLNIGLGRQDPHRLPGHVDSFVEYLVNRGRIPPGTRPAWRGHAYLLYGEGGRRLAGDGVLLAGDAAGLAYPLSGEGIRPAVESGILAARTLLDCRGRWHADGLAAYPRALAARFGKRGGGWLDPLRLVPARLAAAAAGRLLASPSFCRRVVLDRCFFHVRDAPLRT